LLSVLNNIITTDKSVVSMHTPEIKHQSMQWIKKGMPVQSKVITSRTKQMMLVFVDNQALVYTNYVPWGMTVDANYDVRVLRKFLKALQKKRIHLVPGEWSFNLTTH
jgi:hypothetical protein